MRSGLDGAWWEGMIWARKRAFSELGSKSAKEEVERGLLAGPAFVPVGCGRGGYSHTQS